jgi:hypothetical protein
MDAVEIMLPMHTSGLRKSEWSINLVSHSEHLSGLLVDLPNVPTVEMDLHPVIVTNSALLPELITQLCSKVMEISGHAKTNL